MNTPQLATPAARDLHAAMHEEFRWLVPPDFNIARACCTRWADDPSRIAVHHEDEQGNTGTLSYAQLQRQANRLSNVLFSLGARRGDRIALLLPQRPETVVAHIACHQLGAIAMPMSILFGADAIEFRLRDSRARLAIVDHAALENLQRVRLACPALSVVIGVGALNCVSSQDTATPSPLPRASQNTGTAKDKSDRDASVLDWETLMAEADEYYRAVEVKSSDPAMLIYTSGTTGDPKGALLPHAALIGNLSGFVASQNWFPQPGDVFWSPADWAWTGGLMDCLLPTLYFGHPIVGYRGRFSASTAFRLLEKYRVTNCFLFPTALKMMMKEIPQPRQRYRLSLRALMSAGEAVGDAVFEWSQQALGITINEMFGQTEMNYIVGNSASLWPARPGSMGKPYPGHLVGIIDDDGQAVAPGVTGEIALRRTDRHGEPDPVLFLGYWDNSQATAQKYSGEWCRTGDLANADADGYLWYQGRADDMFKAAGYRIGPGEIENCLLRHAAVANAAVVPKPDAERGNIVKAFVVLLPAVVRSASADEQLIAQLQDHVRQRLAPYEYPKEIEFVEELPMTPTGKLQRRVLRLLEASRAQQRAGKESST